MTDHTLVQRILDGDAEAYGVLIDRHYDRCVRIALRIVGNREDAEEAVQDAFVRAYTALGGHSIPPPHGCEPMMADCTRCCTSRVLPTRTFAGTSRSRVSHILPTTSCERPLAHHAGARFCCASRLHSLSCSAMPTWREVE